MRRFVTFFMIVVACHWAEHLVQAVQIYAMGWPVHEARGVLGLWYPWLVHSETLHFGYAVFMFVGLYVLTWRQWHGGNRWMYLAFWIQTWHLMEHSLLLTQAMTAPWFGRAVPTSLLQLVWPRVELHLFYNTIVTIPMLVAMWYRREFRRVLLARLQETNPELHHAVSDSPRDASPEAARSPVSGRYPRPA